MLEDSGGQGPRKVVLGGSVFDPATHAIAPGDIYLDRAAVVAPFDIGAADTVIDATGLLVTPGWVDLHTHIFKGQDLAVDPDALGARTGVTTMIDTGSAGAHLYGAFVRSTLLDAAVRIRAFINISSIGTTSILLSGELQQLAYIDEAACIDAIRDNRDTIIGVKVRASDNVGGLNTLEALRRARRVADEVDLPLMVHIGPAPAAFTAVLDSLGAGDIVTHCFTGLAFPPIADPDDGDRLLEAAVSARQRGVHFDVGHGGGSFDGRRTAAALRAGFLPDTISSDVHAYALQPDRSARAGDDVPAGGVRDVETSLLDGGLPLVVDKMLALGLRLEDALERVTAAPAAVAGLAGLGVGTLRAGAPADVAAFRVVDGEVSFVDTQGYGFSGRCRLRPVLTIQGGAVVFDARRDPDSGGN